MSDGDVADVIAEHMDPTRHGRLLSVARTGSVPDGMGYEDWVRPLKLSGGRVCLREDPPDGLQPAVFDYTIEDGDTLVCQRSTDGAVVDADDAVSWLQDGLAGDETTVRPVLREETPFADTDGGDD